MAHLIAMTFDSETEAANVLKSLRELEKSADLDLEDTAVLVKDRDGEIKTHNEVSGVTEKGIVAGGMLGAVLGFAFPIAGAALVAGGGALLGRVLHAGTADSLVERARGRVWTSNGPDAGATRSRPSPDGRTRHVGTPPAGALLDEPTLEDAYLLLLGESGAEVHR